MHRLYLLALAFLVSLSAPASAQNWTQVGALMCKVDPNIGFIIVGHQPMQCTYTPSTAPASTVSGSLSGTKCPTDRTQGFPCSPVSARAAVHGDQG